ncbi:DNA polymerase III [Methylobacterium sp. Leaf465]|uniref:3'-5' exonuclease n=1 Tax=unclassified Methylobacterium TaxID=2615210 RepID=UPI0006FD4847|nr:MULTISPECIES: 3'-5' exonuclease [unclassified Methylobacterium]KQO71067.1 DNA polymerase III [Methylobacterium sp. Leaf89]KQT70753.1 DNA polymerase III [Methylobacterium sp. Leaf465]
MTVIALDFETANERRDSACAVGLAWIAGGRVVRRESRLIRPPELRFSPGNIRVHGILPADVRGQPDFPTVMAEFLPDLASGLILAHNAGFDLGVLRASLAAHGHRPPAFAYLCTLQIARRVFPAEEGCGLGKVAARLGIRFAHHDAGEDAYACAEIALAAVRETGAPDVPGLSQALRLPITTVPAGPDLALPPRGRPGSLTERARLAAGARPASAPGLHFAVRGSSGNRYAVTLEDRTGGPHLRCTCMAGRYGTRCRHVKALLAGDITDLLSSNHDDVAVLRVRMTAASVG